MAKPPMKLSGVTSLVVDSDRYGVGLLREMMRGLGMEAPVVVETVAEARNLLESREFELCVCESRLSDEPGTALVKWIRRLGTPVRFMSIIMLTEYSQTSNVRAARDAGVNLVIRKPVSPQALYDRIAWVAASTRKFVECDSYVGPDRRFKMIGPPNGIGRRETDLSADIGDAVEPNMSQTEIDMMMKPMKVIAE